MTIYDIAAELKVSPATVSMALNDDSRLSEKTRRKVQEYASKIGFQRNEQARNFRLKRTNTIGVMVHDISSGFWNGAIKAIETEMGADYNVIVCNSNGNLEKEKKLLNNLKTRRVDGIIIEPASRELKHLDKMNSSGVPVVLFERTDNETLSFVKGNDFDAAHRLTDRCLKDGHRKIAFLSYKSEILGVKDRICGFHQACRENGVEDTCELFVASDISISAVEEILLEHIDRFSLVICVDDLIACRLLQLMKRENYSIPRDLSIIGWDNRAFLEYMETPLASVYVPNEEIGKAAASIIKAWYEGRKEPKKIYIEENMVYRESYAIYENMGSVAIDMKVRSGLSK